MKRARNCIALLAAIGAAALFAALRWDARQHRERMIRRAENRRFARQIIREG